MSKKENISSVWRSMKLRCFNKTYPSYQYYGAKGISVCERWLGKEGFKNFVADMGERPDGYQLDRIDNNGNYEPGNCRWASRFEQSRNTSRNKYLSYGGLTLTMADWDARIGGSDGNVRTRLKLGWPLEKALTIPSKKRVKRAALTGGTK